MPHCQVADACICQVAYSSSRRWVPSVQKPINITRVRSCKHRDSPRAESIYWRSEIRISRSSSSPQHFRQVMGNPPILPPISSTIILADPLDEHLQCPLVPYTYSVLSSLNARGLFVTVRTSVTVYLSSCSAKVHLLRSKELSMLRSPVPKTPILSCRPATYTISLTTIKRRPKQGSLNNMPEL